MPMYCWNRGMGLMLAGTAAIGARSVMRTGGEVVGVGLLPSHSPGVYELRIDDGERLVDAYRADRRPPRVQRVRPASLRN
jgi:hypothetical protein